MSTTAAEVAERIVALVNRMDYVSQENICNECGGDSSKGEEEVDLRGDMAVVMERSNVATHYWVSQLFVDAIGILLRERPRRIIPTASCAMTMMIDGVPFPPRGTPYVKRNPPKGGFKREHYLPVTYRPLSALSPKEQAKWQSEPAFNPAQGAS